MFDETLQNVLNEAMAAQTVEKRDVVTFGDVLEGKILGLKETYGFIVCPERPYTRFFFHWTQVRPDTRLFPRLKRGMRVSFTEAYSEKHGPRANNVSMIEEIEAPF